MLYLKYNILIMFFGTKLVNKQPYKNSIGIIRLKMKDLQEIDLNTRGMRQQSLEKNYNKIEETFQYQGFLFLLENI